MQGSIAVVLSATLAACARVPEAPPGAAIAEEAVIRQMTKDWFAAELRHDLKASLSYLAPDAIVESEGAPAITGAAGLQRMYEEQFKIPIADVKMAPRTVVVASSADIAYDVGNFTAVMGGSSPATEVNLKSTIIWRKRDGRWQAVVMAASFDAPPASQQAVQR